MSKYIIPIYNMKELEKKIKTISRKGANIVFDIVKEVVHEYVPSQFGPKIVIDCYEVNIEGSYKINDWEFVGTIEHGEGRNIIRTINDSFSNSIPEKYKTITPECEHCQKIRDRKDTYLIFNSKTKEFKQVGKSCLMNYTNGLDAEFCAKLADVFTYIAKLENPKDIDDEFMKDFQRGINSVGKLETETLKPIIFGYVKKNGYISKETPAKISEIIFGREDNNSTPASNKEIEEMNEWVKSVNDRNSDYLWNAKTAWTKKYATYRDISLLASFVNTFLKNKIERVRRANANNNEYVGKVGDKITISNIKEIRVLFVRNNTGYSYYANDSFIHEIIDNDGHTFIWSTSINLTIKKPLEIVATIKEHKEYKGTKQTVITRGKVTKWAEVKVEPKKSENDMSANDALDSFIKYLEDDE